MLSIASRSFARSFIHLAFRPSADVFSTASALQIALELPGVKQDSIRIDVLKGRLNVFANRPLPLGTETTPIQGERSYGPVFRSFELPSALRTDELDAIFNDGVLTLTIPKAGTSTQ
jgi:HSP20 family protein